jgi:hypothetical protein
MMVFVFVFSPGCSFAQTELQVLSTDLRDRHHQVVESPQGRGNGVKLYFVAPPNRRLPHHMVFDAPKKLVVGHSDMCFWICGPVRQHGWLIRARGGRFLVNRGD